MTLSRPFVKLIIRLYVKDGNKLVDAIDQKWTEEQLDNYCVAHPILGKLTMRELAYFTIYHNIHHMETIRKYYL